MTAPEWTEEDKARLAATPVEALREKAAALPSEELEVMRDILYEAYKAERDRAERAWAQRRDVIRRELPGVDPRLQLAIRQADADLAAVKKAQPGERRAIEAERDAIIKRARAEAERKLAAVGARVRKAKEAVKSAIGAFERASAQLDGDFRRRAKTERPSFFTKRDELSERHTAVCDELLRRGRA